VESAKAKAKAGEMNNIKMTEKELFDLHPFGDRSEETLSDKELTLNNVDWQQVSEFYPREDVKEFIKKLKEELCEQPMMDCGGDECGTCGNCRKINKLVGDKLI